MIRPAALFEQTFPDVDISWLSVPVGLIAAGVVFTSVPVTGDTARMLAITVFCISLWIASPVEPWFTGLLCLGLVGTLFSTDVALVGFQSPAIWLVVLGVLLGEATRQSGLADFVERQALRTLPATVANDATAAYRYLLGVLSLAALGFVVLVPSSLVRVLILGPILISVGELFTDRRAKIGLFLGPLFVTYYGGTGILTGSLVNIIVTGIVESTTGLSTGWVEWMTWLGPVMAVGRSLMVVGIAYILYRPDDSAAITALDSDEQRIGSSDERRMLLFLVVGVVIWATDFLHGLHPLYGALIVTLLAFTPRLGVVGTDAVSDADFSIIFFLGAIFAIAEGLQRTAFTDIAAQTILSLLSEDASLGVVLGVVVLTAIALTFVMEGLAAASVLTPILVSFSASAGVPLLPVVMTEAVALNTYFFPYQSAVLVAILSLDVVDSMELIRMAAICSLATLGVLLPVQIGLFVIAF